MQRAIAGAFLANGETKIHNPCCSDDCLAALGIVQAAGATVVKGTSILISKNTPVSPPKEVFCGESGLGIRMFAPILSLFHEEVIILGGGSLKSRTMNMLSSVLNQLGVQCMTNQGKLPIRVKGPLKNGNVTLNGSITSQFLTGLLMALPVTKGKSIIHVNSLNSRGYIDLTLEALRQFGIVISNENYEVFQIEGNQQYSPCEITIEGDWSGAAFHLVGAAISGKVSVLGLNRSSAQPDKIILEAIASAGGVFSADKNTISVEKGALNNFTFDATNCPDLFPPLAALAANCEGKSVIKGLGRLIHKESNRAQTIKSELKSVGIEVDIKEDEMHITGGEISGGTIDSHNDHRIAMMGGILAINAKSPISIINSKAISKSYPNFFQTLNKLGIQTEEC